MSQNRVRSHKPAIADSKDLTQLKDRTFSTGPSGWAAHRFMRYTCHQTEVSSMGRVDLAKALDAEVARWSLRSYAEVAKLDLDFPQYYTGSIEGQEYNAEALRLEKNNDYIRIVISVYAGGISSFISPNRHIVYHRDGTVNT
ncbi:MAG: hypothetical protein DRP45_04820 [Candidatus Zixiibacteriota bacterium]|nr:MAG: hypothetical protein DRP45_04820 [candidate division Zixibacteria bacterium]